MRVIFEIADDGEPASRQEISSDFVPRQGEFVTLPTGGGPGSGFIRFVRSVDFMPLGGDLGSEPYVYVVLVDSP